MYNFFSNKIICRRILIDTGDSDVPQYVNHLKTVLHNEGVDLAHIFVTHWHHDHIGGIQDVLELNEYTSKFVHAKPLHTIYYNWSILSLEVHVIIIKLPEQT